MKRIGAMIFCVTVFSIFFLTNSVNADVRKDQNKESVIEGLVNEAAGLIETKGKPALNIIEDKNGKFCTKDTYVFVTSGETGADLINPAFQEIEGMPAENYSNPDTKAAQAMIVNAVKDKDTAWIEYLWPKPGETKPSKKRAYLKKIVINGKTRIVGAGFYID